MQSSIAFGKTIGSFPVFEGIYPLNPDPQTVQKEKSFWDTGIFWIVFSKNLWYTGEKSAWKKEGGSFLKKNPGSDSVFGGFYFDGKGFAL